MICFPLLIPTRSFQRLEGENPKAKIQYKRNVGRRRSGVGCSHPWNAYKAHLQFSLHLQDGGITLPQSSSDPGRKFI